MIRTQLRNCKTLLFNISRVSKITKKKLFMSYKPTIGLEVHAELNTKSKMFCGCANQPHGAEPNTYVCPVCMAHPGSLPVANKEAIKMVLQFGVAIKAEQATYSEFDRKNYFYPDIPKAYQISQYQFPFLTNGQVAGVQLTRVHLEEDTARSSHEHTDGSLVDFNRAGVPLMELVTEPVIHDAKQAGDFARELQLLLKTLGISEANMEKGEMRIEANISVSKTEELGTKVEVKNINSFKAVEAAIAYEVNRQVKLLEAGELVAQETRGWDENKSCTFSQRSKETAKDYRYFPDPDLPKIQVNEMPEFATKELSEKTPVLPEKKREILSNLGINADVVETIIADKKQDTLLTSVLEILSGKQKESVLAASYISVDVASLDADEGYEMQNINPAAFAELMCMAVANEVGSRGVKNLLLELPGFEGSVASLAKEKGFIQQSDEGALQEIVIQIVKENSTQVDEYKAGKEAVLKFLVGQGMKLTKGSANPQVLEKLLIAEITK